MKKLLLLALILSFTFVGSTVPALAVDKSNCPESSTQNQDPKKGPIVPDVQRDCDPALKPNQADYCSNTNVTGSNCTLVGSFIQPAVDFLSVLFGILIVAAIIYGGIEYASSGGDPSKTAAGKNRIRNALIALVGYVFIIALLNFIVPGALF